MHLYLKNLCKIILCIIIILFKLDEELVFSTHKWSTQSNLGHSVSHEVSKQAIYLENAEVTETVRKLFKENIIGRHALAEIIDIIIIVCFYSDKMDDAPVLCQVVRHPKLG